MMVSIQLRVDGMWKAECCVRLGGVNRSTPYTRWTVNLLLRETPCSDDFSITFTRVSFQNLTLEQADEQAVSSVPVDKWYKLKKKNRNRFKKIRF